MGIFYTRGWLPATYDREWTPRSRSICITGLAQVGGVWLRLYQETGDVDFRRAGIAAVEQAAALQKRSRWSAIDGAVAGSFPMTGATPRSSTPTGPRSSWPTRSPSENGSSAMAAELAYSVVIPAYNAEPTVARVVEALRAQAPAPAEIIVVDDASTDGTSAAATAAGATVVANETSPCRRGAERRLGGGGLPRRLSGSSGTPTSFRPPAGAQVSPVPCGSSRTRSSAARARSTAARPGAGSRTFRARRRTCRSESRGRCRSSPPTASRSPGTHPSAGTRATAARTASSARTPRPPATGSSSTRGSTRTTTTAARPGATLRRQQQRMAYGIARTRRVVDEGTVRRIAARVPAPPLRAPPPPGHLPPARERRRS